MAKDKETPINAVEHAFDQALARLIGSGFRDLITEERPMPVIRKQLSEWWSTLTEDQKEEYAPRLRFKLERIHQAAEAFSQELQSASGR